MSVDIENSSVSVLTHRMLHAPVYMEAEWGCQRLRPSGWLQGQRSCEETEGRAAPCSSSVQCSSMAQSAVCGRTDGAYWPSFFCFFASLPAAHKTVIILTYSVWRGPSGWSGCKSSKRVWMEAYPLRRGRRCKLKMTRSHLSGRFLLSRVCFASENFPPLTYCFAALQKEISPVTALLTDIFFDIRGWAVLMLDSDTQWLHHFSSYI